MPYGTFASGTSTLQPGHWQTRVYICANIQALASQAHLDHLFSRGMRVIDLYPQKLWVSLVIGILYLSVMPASIMAQLLPMGIPLPIWQLHLFELESVNA